MNFLRRILKNKSILAVLAVAIIGGGYFGYKSMTAKAVTTSYVLAQAQLGTVIQSISGTGQVSATNQADIKPKVSGQVTDIAVQNSQTVKAGALLVRIDDQSAQKAVRDAQANLQSAQLSLQKLLQPADALSLTQSQNQLAQAQESKDSAVNDLQTAYDNGFSNVATAFLNLPSIMTGLQNILYTTSPGLGTAGQWNLDYYANVAAQYNASATSFRADANDKYQIARTAYDQNFTDYKATDRTAPTTTIESLINESYATTKDIADAVKSASNLIQFYEDKLTSQNLQPASIADTQLASLNTYTGQVNSQLSNLLGSVNTIQSDKQAIVNADRSITADQESLAKLQAGADPIDIQSSQLSVQQRQNALLDAEQTLADYSVHAPFDGTIAALNVKLGDQVGSGSAVATLITQQKLAEVSLNEIDAAKVQVGQKATLTFDAIDGLSLTGEVAEIDTIGTVTQGVVSYNVKIGFDSQDERIKPGMSVSAQIITDVKQDVLTVPNSAVKAQGGNSYVQRFDNLSQADQQAGLGNSGFISKLTPRQEAVTVGASNDSLTEITGGLQAGDLVVTRTVSSGGTAAASSASASGQAGGLRIPGFGGGFGAGR